MIRLENGTIYEKFDPETNEVHVCMIDGIERDDEGEVDSILETTLYRYKIEPEQV